MYAYKQKGKNMEGLKRWWCEFWGHDPKKNPRHYRIKEAVGYEFDDDYEDRHWERYSVCARCGEEIRYLRFTHDSWITEEMTKERIGTRGSVGKWLKKEDADRILED